MRTKNSCRFTEYYKIEYYDERFFVWRPIQKAHSTQEIAVSLMPKNKKCRLLKITEKGIEIL